MVKKSYGRRPASSTPNEVFVAQRLNWEAFDNLRKAMYIRIEKFGSERISIDFQRTEAILPNGIVPLIALVKKYQTEGVAVEVIPPRSVDLNNLVKFEGWFYSIDPSRFGRPEAHGYNSLPLRVFSNDTE